jgi:hypothetical protein
LAAKKHWKALIAVAAVILIVAVAVVLINRPTPSAEPQPDALTATGKFGFPVSTIKIGEGGTKTASDGKTPIGYNGDCDSAVQAAANYAPVLQDINIRTWGTQTKVLAEIGVPGPWMENAKLLGDVTASANDLPPGAFDGGWIDRTDVKAGGMYRQASCEAKKKAVVQVFTGSVGAQTNAAPVAGYATGSMELSWDGDWKITDALVLSKDEAFGGRIKDKGPAGPVDGGENGTMPKLTATQLNKLFEGLSREGWIEYANATR